MEREAEEARRRGEEEVARDGELSGDVDDSGGEHVDEQGGELTRFGCLGSRELEERVSDLVLVFLYEEGDEGDGGLVLIGCGRVHGGEVEESDVSG